MTPLEVAASLAICLCAQIEADGLPPTCFCGVVPGSAATQDYMGDCSDDEPCGMAWVRVTSIYPSTVVGQQDTSFRNCSKRLGFDLEVGIMRCIPVGTSDGGPPPDDEVLGAAETQLTEALAMREAISCCPALESMGVILGAYTPLGPLGGLVGGTWLVYVGL